MTAFVVCRNSDVNEFGRRVSVAERDDWDIDVGSFFDSLGIGARVRDDDEAGLFERASDVVGEIAGSEAASDSNSTGVSGELQDSALAVRTSRNNCDISWVVDCCDDAGCEDDFLPKCSRVSLGRLVA